ncbi:MAG TPA: DeoR/GlpR family DNA-binding transcription regulator [Naasia sp.]
MRYTEAPARRAELLRRLSAHGYVSSAALAEEFGVSEMTIRRDLRQLHIEGLARRVAGGASLPLGGARGLPFEERDRSAALEKAALAEACATELGDAETIALDAGTTVAGVAELLQPGTTVVSHSMPVLAAATARDDLVVVGLGGTWSPATRSFTGEAARKGLDRVVVDVAVLSATAVDGSGALCANEFDAETKRAMVAAARRTILLVDSTKIGARAPIRFAPLSSFDLVVTGDDLGDDQRALLAAARSVVYSSSRLADAR